MHGGVILRHPVVTLLRPIERDAEDVVLREHVALKTLPQHAAAEERAIERLKREIALARPSFVSA